LLAGQQLIPSPHRMRVGPKPSRAERQLNRSLADADDVTMPDRLNLDVSYADPSRWSHNPAAPIFELAERRVHVLYTLGVLLVYGQDEDKH
jgi:hypothetical protein